MKTAEVPVHESYPDPHHHSYGRTIFGMWLYLLSDFIFFGALFATYIVLKDSTFGGPSSSQLFSPPFTLVQTLVMLCCSFSVGLGGAAAHRKEKNRTIILFGATFLLGLIFMGMEWSEFSRYLKAGHGWEQSAFLSAYYTIIGTHGVHVLFGLLWIIVLLVPVWREGITHTSMRRLTALRMFWQFINMIWVLIFSFVYLLGAK
jgi:cytochrome o ubiquinol oxidase subunit 3